jgi:hypothetical protein
MECNMISRVANTGYIYLSSPLRRIQRRKEENCEIGTYDAIMKS